MISFSIICTAFRNHSTPKTVPPSINKEVKLRLPTIWESHILPSDLEGLYILDQITIQKIDFRYDIKSVVGAVYYRSLISYYCPLFSSQPVITFNIPVPIGAFPFIYHLHLIKSLADGDPIAQTDDMDHKILRCDWLQVWESLHEVYSTAFKVTFIKNGPNFQVKNPDKVSTFIPPPPPLFLRSLALLPLESSQCSHHTIVENIQGVIVRKETAMIGVFLPRYNTSMEIFYKDPHTACDSNGIKQGIFWSQSGFFYYISKKRPRIEERPHHSCYTNSNTGNSKMIEADTINLPLQ